VKCLTEKICKSFIISDYTDYTLQRLPYYQWVSVFWNLRSFVRPYGGVGEGRLDFYHRILSEVVRKRLGAFHLLL